MGKGAGSFPTASAVLSDISALLYDYNYEYRKTEIVNGSFSSDFNLRVYVGSSNEKLLNELNFQQIETYYKSKNYAYQIGWMNFQQIESLSLNENPNLSLIVFPEEIA
jgi:homoserine dehydrogenase